MERKRGRVLDGADRGFCHESLPGDWGEDDEVDTAEELVGGIVT
jgi:hypothetical protein